jgi:hypothetical protein
MFTYF